MSDLIPHGRVPSSQADRSRARKMSAATVPGRSAPKVTVSPADKQLDEMRASLGNSYTRLRGGR